MMNISHSIVVRTKHGALGHGPRAAAAAAAAAALGSRIEEKGPEDPGGGGLTPVGASAATGHLSCTDKGIRIRIRTP